MSLELDFWLVTWDEFIFHFWVKIFFALYNSSLGQQSFVTIRAIIEGAVFWIPHQANKTERNSKHECFFSLFSLPYSIILHAFYRYRSERYFWTLLPNLLTAWNAHPGQSLIWSFLQWRIFLRILLIAISIYTYMILQDL